jgi:type IV pilus assembly protein PilY1
MNSKLLRIAGALAAACLMTAVGHTQAIVTENFTNGTTINPWYFINGACLTAGTSSSLTSPGSPPACTAIQNSYYGSGNPLQGGQNGVFPDSNGSGALRFTNGGSFGYAQNGAIISTVPFASSAGVQVTFKTYTYYGDSDGPGGDGADGMSFFLMDGSVTPNIGAWGGSLGYTCSNQNPPYNGLIGAYLGLGIDEYGNFLNGSTGTYTSAGLGSAGFNANDNTASGLGANGQTPEEIGLRGAGNVNWTWLNTYHPSLYPSTLTAAQQQLAVRETCASGFYQNFANVGALPYGAPTVTAIPDYGIIPGGNVVLPAGTLLANEGSNQRSQANAMTYRLKITSDGLLSLSYAVNNAAFQQIITRQSITASNGALPATFAFGFAGSTGGSDNIHEIACFQAGPGDEAGSSATANEKEAGKLETGSQAYFAYYDPVVYTGRLTANTINTDALGNVTINSTANWDASCVLTGVAASSTCATTAVAGPTTAQSYLAGTAATGNRTIMTWNGTSGIPFEWANLTAAQKSVLDASDATPINTNRLNYLRGQRANEVGVVGSLNLFRPRDSVLADIIDSSPYWVGPPTSPFTGTWKDRLYSAAAMPENSGQSYQQFVTAEQTRENVVYAGANDGLLHGFRSGSFSATGAYVNNATTPNDGEEVIAYMPGAVLNTIHSTTANVDYANTNYGHQFYVDGSPSSGDLYYQSAWHTWLVGGLGPGGAAIYALDVTSDSNFYETNAANVVIGEWTSSNISCFNNTPAACGNNLGNTYGIPLIRRMHDGNWAVIFGNGWGSSTGDAGVYIMVVNSTTAAKTFYYLSTHTGSVGSPNGIAYVAAADLDGDHVSDYLYAGDLKGNMWRFDVTSQTETNWAAGSAPLFTASAGQPITTKPVIASGAGYASPLQQLMVAFGTGKETPFTNANPVAYAPAAQDLYGVWDWNMNSWNSLSAAQYASLSVGPPNTTGLSSPYTIVPANLAAQTATLSATTGNVDMSSSAVICWEGSTTCANNNNKFGWMLPLVAGADEQITYNPELIGSVFTVNSVVPANNSTTACVLNVNGGFTYGISMITGGVVPGFFPLYNDTQAVAVNADATGSSDIVTSSSGTWLIQQHAPGGPGGPIKVNPPNNITVTRLTWTELR